MEVFDSTPTHVFHGEEVESAPTRVFQGHEAGVFMEEVITSPPKQVFKASEAFNSVPGRLFQGGEVVRDCEYHDKVFLRAKLFTQFVLSGGVWPLTTEEKERDTKFVPRYQGHVEDGDYPEAFDMDNIREDTRDEHGDDAEEIVPLDESGEAKELLVEFDEQGDLYTYLPEEEESSDEIDLEEV